VLGGNIARSKAKSKSRSRARAVRDKYVSEVVNQLPWDGIKTLFIEKLKFSRKTTTWQYRQVITKIEQKAQLNRVQVVAVNPAYTSQCCPECNMTSKDNRRQEKFKCVSCGYEADADYVGACNVLKRGLKMLELLAMKQSSETLGSLESPKLQNSLALS
jgi:IS605 OrfB family transposase